MSTSFIKALMYLCLILCVRQIKNNISPCSTFWADYRLIIYDEDFLKIDHCLLLTLNKSESKNSLKLVSSP
jgi:hypothetical protein